MNTHERHTTAANKMPFAVPIAYDDVLSLLNSTTTATTSDNKTSFMFATAGATTTTTTTVSIEELTDDFDENDCTFVGLDVM